MVHPDVAVLKMPGTSITVREMIVVCGPPRRCRSEDARHINQGEMVMPERGLGRVRKSLHTSSWLWGKRRYSLRVEEFGSRGKVWRQHVIRVELDHATVPRRVSSVIW